MIEIQQCPLCGSQRRRFFEEALIHGVQVRNWICEDCTLVFQSPRMDEDELSVYYGGAYRVEQQGTEAPTEAKIAFERERARALAGMVLARVPAVKCHLDVGCAAGELLLAMNARTSGRMIGIEPSPTYRAHTQSLGVEMFSSLEQFTQESAAGRVDLVTLSHVLEHMPDPVGTLQHIRRSVIAADGHLFVEVPNLFIHTSFEPSHLYAFHAGTLQDTLARAGFETVHCFTHHEPRPDPRGHYLSAIARVADQEAATGPHRSAWMVGLRRRFQRSRAGLVVQHPAFVTRLVSRRLIHGKAPT